MESGFDSDSDFYGQKKAVALLKKRVHLADRGVAQATTTPITPGDASPRKQPPQLYNPFAGVPYAWQLGESVENFLARLPPATSQMNTHTPWIYICNPFVDRQQKSATESQCIAGCEDEGPEANGSQTLLFVEGGRERLELLGNFLSGLPKMGLSRRAATIEANTARKAAVKDVLSLASHLGVRCGKWMLFVRPDRVNETWKTVVCATSRGELGIAAKVAPHDPALDTKKGPPRDRLICIYTADFQDSNDVCRVLRQIDALRLLHGQQDGRILYKCDAFTYLGIGAQNPWGLRASLFSSSDILAATDVNQQSNDTLSV